MENIASSQATLTTEANTVLNTDYFKYFNSWLQQSSKKDQKGLKILYSVHLTAGKKRFKPKAQSIDEKISSTAEQLRKKYMKTSYVTEFGGFIEENEPEIFKLRSVNEMEYKVVLKPLSLMHTDLWLKLNDDPYYKTCVLSFLRCYFSYCKVQQNQLFSTHRESYKWCDTPHPTNFTPQTLQSTIPKLHKRAVSLSLPCEPLLPTVDRGYKLRATQGHEGNGKITNWISNLSNISSYQNSFIPYVHKRILARKADFRTSIVTRLLPSK